MIWLLTTLGVCFANGQSSHLWISARAIEQLPQEALYDLLSDPNLERFWRNGTMFPDGGYAVGDAYGEIAHWEPFQMAYLGWIKETYSPPWSEEAKQHIAFLMGLASHGLADQSYDSMYFRRAYIYDSEGMWTESFDTATDVAFVAETEGQPTVDVWVPYTTFLPLFSEQGHTVSTETISDGQNRLNVAVYWVGTTAAQPDLVETYLAQFPWGTSQQLNPEVPGNPIMESEIVATYWQTLWEKLHDTEMQQPLLFAHPKPETYQHPRSIYDIESGLSIGLSVGIDANQLLPEHIQVFNPQGEQHPIVVDVFYGQDSHILNIDPLEDWMDGEHLVRLSPNLPLRTGQVLGDLHDETVLEWWFSTSEEPLTPEDTKRGCQSVFPQTTIWWVSITFVAMYRRQRCV